MTISASFKKKHPRFFSERIHAPADSFISNNEGMNEPAIVKAFPPMRTLKQLTTAADFWSEMVQPDYQYYLTRPQDLRAALHAAISLFHMSDWVFHTHEPTIGSDFA